MGAPLRFPRHIMPSFPPYVVCPAWTEKGLAADGLFTDCEQSSCVGQQMSAPRGLRQASRAIVAGTACPRGVSGPLSRRVDSLRGKAWNRPRDREVLVDELLGLRF